MLFLHIQCLVMLVVDLLTVIGSFIQNYLLVKHPVTSRSPELVKKYVLVAYMQW